VSVTVTPRRRRTGGRRRTVLVGLAVVALLAALTAAAFLGGTGAGALDPGSPDPSGARAVARVLERQGVPVDVVRDAAGLRDARVDRGTTLVVTGTSDLGRTTARRLGRVATRAGALVLADPPAHVLDALRLPLEPAEGPPGAERSRAGCGDRLLSGLELSASYAGSYRATGGGVTSCFRAGDRGALVARVDADVPTYVLGASDLLRNDTVEQADDAAVALRLLGQGDRVLWYVPDSADVAPGDGGPLAAELPDALLPSLWLGGAALLALALWRGRRLGRLVVEPLPVVVKAVESTQGRGRLYRRVRDREHAALVLRTAARGRLAARLRMPSHADLRGLVEGVARATGRHPAEVHDVLAARPVPDDTALTRLARDLATLEKEVHHP